MTSRLPIEQRGARSKWTYDTESIEYAYRATVMISFVLVSLQAIVLGTRFPWAIGKPHSAAKLILACEFVLAWCFNVVSTWLAIFAPNDETVCNTAVYFCTFFYFANKASIYLFYIEKTLCLKSIPRHINRFYITNMCIFIIPFTIITVNFTINTITRETGQAGGCWTGVLPLGTVPIVSFDIVFSSYMCLCFIIPLLSIKSEEFESSAVTAERRDLRRLCERTAVVTTISLFATGINLFTLVGWEVMELPFCAFSCQLDTSVTSIAISWYTAHSTRSTSSPKQHNRKPHQSANLEGDTSEPIFIQDIERQDPRATLVNSSPFNAKP